MFSRFGYDGDDWHEVLTSELVPVSEWILDTTEGYEDSFEGRVRTVTDQLADLLVEKNQSYGNAALDPVSIFSNASPVERLGARIDEKLARLARGHEYPGDDTVWDLMGSLVLFYLAKQDEESE